MVDALSVAAAARILGVHESRVRDLVRRGALEAEKLGRDLVLDRADVLALRDRERPSGRRLSARNAWALLAILNRENPEWAKRTTLLRLRRLSREADWVVRSLLHSEPRAWPASWELLPVDVAQIGRRPGLVKTGMSAATDLSDLVPVSDPVVDVYASSSSVNDLRRQFRPVVSAKTKPNVVVRVPTEDWILGHAPVAPPAVVGADLLLERSQRSRRAGERILRALVEHADRDS